MFRIRISFTADPDPAFASMRIQIRIQGAKPMRIHADPNPDPGQPSQKVGHENILHR
jgi:hypothetical protein